MSATIVLVILLAIFVGVALVIRLQLRELRRADYIRTYRFPDTVLAELRHSHPHLDRKQQDLVAQGLRQFFIAYLEGGRKFVAMPSRVADDLWHAFILDTRRYAAFCEDAFGRFLHHAPAAVLGGDKRLNEGLRRVWWHSCQQEGIDARTPSRLPLLFALDGKLGIVGGHVYAATRMPGTLTAAPAHSDVGVMVYYGEDMGSREIDGSTDGFGGDGGGDGGGGCGGD